MGGSAAFTVLAIEEAINQAIASGDTMLLRECAYAMKTNILNSGHVPEQRFNFWLRLLNEQDFLNLGGAWCFIIVLGENEELLSDDQEQRLLPSIRCAHEAFHEMNPELITEAIYQAIAAGQRYTNAGMLSCH